MQEPTSIAPAHSEDKSFLKSFIKMPPKIIAILL
jgi:hypothetical protein